MEIFLDTADIDEIMEAQRILSEAETKLDGITTNPTTVAKAMKKYKSCSARDVVLRLADEVDGHISVEARGSTRRYPYELSKNQFVDEAHAIREWHPRFVVKIPCTPEGIEATREVYREIPVNMTLCFSLDDIYCAADAGARFTSLFVGRIDERIAGSGNRTAKQAVEFLSDGKYGAKFIFASAREPQHVQTGYQMGAHILTMPYGVFLQIGEGYTIKAMQNETKHNNTPEPIDVGEREIKYPLKHTGLHRFLKDAIDADYRILDI